MLSRARDAYLVATKNSSPAVLRRLFSSMTSMRRKRWNPREKGWNPWGKTVEPSKQVVCERARGCVLWSYHQNFLSSIAAAAACPLIRAVDPRRPASHSGHRVAPRPDNRLSPSSPQSLKFVIPRLSCTMNSVLRSLRPPTCGCMYPGMSANGPPPKL